MKAKWFSTVSASCAKVVLQVREKGA